MFLEQPLSGMLNAQVHNTFLGQPLSGMLNAQVFGSILCYYLVMQEFKVKIIV
jgi:hypothetical protein